MWRRNIGEVFYHIKFLYNTQILGALGNQDLGEDQKCLWVGL
jgi:hypothetical protein